MRKGFTLVELSIVLVIIGLLIGGILVAQSMTDTARTQKLINEIQQWNIQSTLFKERFKYYPADLPNALSIFGSCNNSGSGCNGNGDGLIRPTGVANQGRYEDALFFHHLYLAGLSNGVSYGTTFVAGAACYIPVGLCGPSLSYHKLAGVRVQNGADTAPALDSNSNYFVIGGDVAGYYQNAWLRPGIIKPADAATFDSKMDDGIPNSGNVQSHNSSSSSSGTESLCFPGSGSVATGSKYVLTHKDYIGGCHMKIKIQEGGI